MAKTRSSSWQRSSEKQNTKGTQRTWNKNKQSSSSGGWNSQNQIADNTSRSESYKDLSMLPEGYKAAMEYSQRGYLFDPSKDDDINRANALKTEAQNAVKNLGPYSSNYSKGIQDTLNRILNREDFSYDFNADALYNQYKDAYMQQGKIAAQNAAAGAALNSGGYGNSYGTTAAALANQQYMTQLNDKIPELYQLALDRYNNETNNLYNKYNVLGTQDDREYGRYVDERANLVSDRDYYSNDYYNIYGQKENTANNNFNNALNLAQQGIDTYGRDITNVNEHSESNSNYDEGSWQESEGSENSKTVNDETTVSSSSTTGGSVSSGSGKSGKQAEGLGKIDTAIKSKVKKYTDDGDNTKAFYYVNDLIERGVISAEQGVLLCDVYGIKYESDHPERNKAWTDWMHSDSGSKNNNKSAVVYGADAVRNAADEAAKKKKKKK